jgi:hypothetical protein
MRYVNIALRFLLCLAVTVCLIRISEQNPVDSHQEPTISNQDGGVAGAASQTSTRRDWTRGYENTGISWNGRACHKVHADSSLARSIEPLHDSVAGTASVVGRVNWSLTAKCVMAPGRAVCMKIVLHCRPTARWV